MALRLTHCDGELLVASEGDGEEIIYADIDPVIARQKRIVKIPGEYEIDRVGHRRPEMYGPLCAGRDD